MLLTNLIPPKSSAHKEALSCFNRFIEEPHEDPSERLELVICGGRGCGKSTLAAGLVFKGATATGDDVVVIRKRLESFRNDTYPCLQWVAHKIPTPFLSEPMPHSGFCTIDNAQGLPKMKFIDAEGSFDMFRNSLDILHCYAVKPKIVWVEGCDDFESEEAVKSLIDGLDFAPNPVIIYTFNPPMYKNHWLCKFAGLDGSPLLSRRRVFRSDYLDMPVDFLGQKFFENAEKLRHLNPDAYRNIYLGESIDDAPDKE